MTDAKNDTDVQSNKPLNPIDHPVGTKAMIRMAVSPWRTYSPEKVTIVKWDETKPFAVTLHRVMSSELKTSEVRANRYLVEEIIPVLRPDPDAQPEGTKLRIGGIYQGEYTIADVSVEDYIDSKREDGSILRQVFLRHEKQEPFPGITSDHWPSLMFDIDKVEILSVIDNTDEKSETSDYPTPERKTWPSTPVFTQVDDRTAEELFFHHWDELVRIGTDLGRKVKVTVE